MEKSEYTMYSELVEVAVEHALVTMGSPELNKVKEMLKEKYNCTLADSLKHPDYLKNILCELFGHSYQDIIDTIYSVLEKQKDEEIIKKFLTIMET